MSHKGWHIHWVMASFTAFYDQSVTINFAYYTDWYCKTIIINFSYLTHAIIQFVFRLLATVHPVLTVVQVMKLEL